MNRLGLVLALVLAYKVSYSIGKVCTAHSGPSNQASSAEPPGSQRRKHGKTSASGQQHDSVITKLSPVCMLQGMMQRKQAMQHGRAIPGMPAATESPAPGLQMGMRRMEAEACTAKQTAKPATGLPFLPSDPAQTRPQTPWAQLGSPTCPGGSAASPLS